jgi:hypothetical protein
MYVCVGVYRNRWVENKCVELAVEMYNSGMIW